MYEKVTKLNKQTMKMQLLQYKITNAEKPKEILLGTLETNRVKTQ